MRTLRPGLYGDDPLATVRLPQRGSHTLPLCQVDNRLCGSNTSPSGRTCYSMLANNTQLSTAVQDNGNGEIYCRKLQKLKLFPKPSYLMEI